MNFIKSKDGNVLICILFDGLGYDIVKKTSFSNNVLEDLRPLKTVLGYSPAAQTSILTGLYPEEHGGLCVYYRSKDSVFDWMRIFPLISEDIRKKLLKDAARVTRSLFNITGHFNIWDIPYEILPYFQLFEQKSIYASHPFETFLTILDEARDTGVSISTYWWNTPEEQILFETEEKLRKRQASFHFLYISKTDHLIHTLGNNIANIKNEIDFYDKRIRQIYKIAKENYHEVSLLVFSDHGMLDITDRIDVMTPISGLSYHLGKDYLAFYDATMVRFWFDNPSCRQEIIDIMLDIKGIRLLSDFELKRLGCLFPDRRYGEMIYLAESGKIISPNYFGSQNNILAMHGYHPEENGYEAFAGSSNIDIREIQTIKDLHMIMRQQILKKFNWLEDKEDKWKIKASRYS